MSADLEKRIQCALSRVCATDDLYGELLCAFPTVVAELEPGMLGLTDGQRIRVGRACARLPLDQLCWLLAHEATHILLHHTRVLHLNREDPELWTWAVELETDMCVPRTDLFRPISRARQSLVHELELLGLNTHVRIYQWLRRNRERVARLSHVDRWTGSGSEAQVRDVRERVRQLLERVRARSPLSNAMDLLLERLERPLVHWADELEQWLSDRCGQWGYDPSRVSDHHWVLHDLAVPAFGPGRGVDLSLALDTSGSMVGPPLRRCLSQIRGLNGLVGPVRVYICDCRVHQVLDLAGVSDAELEHVCRALRGRGGTDFRPVFELIEQEPQPRLLLYLSDTQGEYPKKHPGYDVLWLVPDTAGGSWCPPFGRVLRIPADDMDPTAGPEQGRRQGSADNGTGAQGYSDRGGPSSQG